MSQAKDSTNDEVNEEDYFIKPHVAQLKNGGLYNAIVTETKVLKNHETAYGTEDKYVIVFETIDGDPEYQGVEINRLCTKRKGEGSTLRSIVVPILGEMPALFDVRSLIGKKCRILIEHKTNEKTGDVWDNIAKVFPYDEGAD